MRASIALPAKYFWKYFCSTIQSCQGGETDLGCNKGSGSVASVLTGAGLGAAPIHVGMFSSFLRLSVGGICSLRALGAGRVLHLSALSAAKICC